jgi:hypothetical protein
VYRTIHGKQATASNCDVNKINYMANERHLVAKTVPLPAMHMIHADAFPSNFVIARGIDACTKDFRKKIR